METSMIDMVWAQLQNEIANVRQQAEVALARSERSELSGGVKVVAYAALPNAAGGAGDGDVLKVSNARKVGEGAGAGTGTLAYYNPSDDTWRRVGDDTIVVI